MQVNIKKAGRLHFTLLAILICNFGLGVLFGFGLNTTIIAVLKGVMYTLGIILFFASIIPFKKIAVYYFFYVITPAIIGAFYFMGGITLALLSSLVLSPIMPLEAELAKNNIKVYSHFNGFFSPCCKYHTTERIFFVFEKFKGLVHTSEPLDFENATITFKNDSLFVNADGAYKMELSR